MFRVWADGSSVFARDDASQRVCISSLKEVRITHYQSLIEVIGVGNALRRHGKSGVNPHSSRSHSILQFELRNPAANISNTQRSRKPYGKLTFIDLAGSERACEANFYAQRQAKYEGAEINQSLLALKECIRAMDDKRPHAPFRQSKLTQVLRDSFLDACLLSMLAVVSPGHAACDNTLNTLRYAARVADIDAAGLGRARERQGGSVSGSAAPVLVRRDISSVEYRDTMHGTTTTAAGNGLHTTMGSSAVHRTTGTNAVHATSNALRASAHSHASQSTIGGNASLHGTTDNNALLHGTTENNALLHGTTENNAPRHGTTENIARHGTTENIARHGTTENNALYGTTNGVNTMHSTLGSSNRMHATTTWDNDGTYHNEEDTNAILAEYLRYFHEDTLTLVPTWSAGGTVNSQVVGAVNSETVGAVNSQVVGAVNSEVVGAVNSEEFGAVNSDSMSQYDVIPVRDTTPSICQHHTSQPRTPTQTILPSHFTAAANTGEAVAQATGTNTGKPKANKSKPGKKGKKLAAPSAADVGKGKNGAANATLPAASKQRNASKQKAKKSRDFQGRKLSGGVVKPAVDGASVCSVSMQSVQVQTEDITPSLVGRSSDVSWLARSHRISDILDNMERLAVDIHELRSGFGGAPGHLVDEFDAEPQSALVTGASKVAQELYDVPCGPVIRCSSVISNASTIAEVPSIAFSSSLPVLTGANNMSKHEIVDYLESMCQEEISVLDNVKEDSQELDSNTRHVLLNIYQSKVDKLTRMKL